MPDVCFPTACVSYSSRSSIRQDSTWASKRRRVRSFAEVPEAVFELLNRADVYAGLPAQFPLYQLAVLSPGLQTGGQRFFESGCSSADKRGKNPLKSSAALTEEESMDRSLLCKILNPEILGFT